MISDVDRPTLNTLSLCSGIGMLDQGLHAGLEFLGIGSRTILFAEREAYPVGVLAARMEEGSLPAAPIWFGDFTELPARQFHGMVDCVAAGFPCQDLSVAGRRAGLDGKRSGLFFEVVRIATVCGARLMLLENVSGISSATATVMDEAEGELDERAAARVVGELADLGWDSEWVTLSASEVGASHGRARWFCLAWRMDDAMRAEWRTLSICGSGGKQGQDGAEHPGAGDELGYADQQQQQQQDDADCTEPRCDSWACAGRTSSELADTSGPRPQRRELGRACKSNWRGQEAHGSAGQLRGLFAPGPADQGWAGILAGQPWLSPALSIEEQLDAEAAFETTQSVFCRVANGMAAGLDFCNRAARLKCCGNGVVAAQASVAVVELVRRAGLFGYKDAD